MSDLDCDALRKELEAVYLLPPRLRVAAAAAIALRWASNSTPESIRRIPQIVAALEQEAQS